MWALSFVEATHAITFAAHFEEKSRMRITFKSTYRKAFRSFLMLVFGIVLVLSSWSVAASDETSDSTKKDGFKAGEMIVHHISDGHSIHFVGHLSMPLPCIVKTDKGFDFFMSSVFNDEHHEPTKTYHSAKTGNTYALHHEVIYVVDPANAMQQDHHVDHTGHMDHHDAQHESHDLEMHDGEVEIVLDSNHVGMVEAIKQEEPKFEEAHFDGTSVTDFSITKSIFGMFLMLGLVMFLFIKVAKSASKNKGKAPKGLQNVLEPLIIFIRDEVAIPSLGKKRAAKFLPFLLTIFFFIWACNLFGLIPFLGGFNITGTLSITLVLATLVFIITSVNGNGHYWGHIVWPPGVPFAIKVILVPIEIASIFIKPAVLMIRLTANINAGHIIILAFTSLVLIFGEKGAVAGYGVGIFSTAFMIFMYFIELLVAFLQAYVFVLLTALYFSDATQEHHHEEVAHQ